LRSIDPRNVRINSQDLSWTGLAEKEGVYENAKKNYRRP